MYNMGATKQVGALNVRELIDVIKYKKEYAKAHPDDYPFCGIMGAIGPQGSGKTYSMYCYVKANMLMYPKLKLLTNVHMSLFPIVTEEDFINARMENPLFIREYPLPVNRRIFLAKMYKQENRVYPFYELDDILKYDNGPNGLIVFADDLLAYANNKQSGKLGDSIQAKLAQLRKSYVHIVTTIQCYSDYPIEVRRQFDTICRCKCIGGVFQDNAIITRQENDNIDFSDTKLNDVVVSERVRFFHKAHIYKEYDTRQRLVKGEI